MPYVNKGLSTKICSFIEDVTGSIITINNQFNDRLLSLKATIEATQQGSGTPSPDNVRPIVGVSEVNITQQVTDMADRIYTINLGGTYYGGVLDVTNGVLRVTHFYFKCDSDLIVTMFDHGSTTSWFQLNLANNNFPSAVANSIMSSHLVNAVSGTNRVRNTKTIINFTDIENSLISPENVVGFKNWLINNNVEFCYEIDESEQYEVQLTPTEVQLAIRQNTFFADSGDIEAIYKTYTPT